MFAPIKYSAAICDRGSLIMRTVLYLQQRVSNEMQGSCANQNKHGRDLVDIDGKYVKRMLARITILSGRFGTLRIGIDTETQSKNAVNNDPRQER